MLTEEERERITSITNVSRRLPATPATAGKPSSEPLTRRPRQPYQWLAMEEQEQQRNTTQVG